MPACPKPETDRNPEYRAWIRTLPCWVCGRWPVDPAHVKPYGSSMKDMGNIVSLCRRHHDEQEGNTAAFEKKYGVNLEERAKELGERYARL